MKILNSKLLTLSIAAIFSLFSGSWLSQDFIPDFDPLEGIWYYLENGFQYSIERRILATQIRADRKIWYHLQTTTTYLDNPKIKSKTNISTEWISREHGWQDGCLLLARNGGWLQVQKKFVPDRPFDKYKYTHSNKDTTVTLEWKHQGEHRWLLAKVREDNPKKENYAWGYQSNAVYGSQIGLISYEGNGKQESEAFGRYLYLMEYRSLNGKIQYRTQYYDIYN